MKAPIRYLDPNVQWKKLFSKTEPFQPVIPAVEPLIKMYLPYRINYIQDPKIKESQGVTKEALIQKHFVSPYQEVALEQLTKLCQNKSTKPLDQSLGRLCQIF